MPIIIGQNNRGAAAAAPGSPTASGPAAAVLDVNYDNFEPEVIHRSMKTPVLLDLWAAWCAPCKALGPILEKLAREFNGAFVLAKLDVDANQEIAQLLQVRTIPTVFLFKNGQPVDGFASALPESEIRKFLAKHVKPATPKAEAPEGASAADLLGDGDPDGALELLKNNPDPSRTGDPILQVRALVLAGQPAEAGAILAALAKDKREEALSLVEAAERVHAVLQGDVPELRTFRDAVIDGRLKDGLDSLLASFTEEKRSLFLDLLNLMGRGAFSDEYRTRLARVVFR